ncbi:MAG: DUF559 domain-containing protein [Gemmatimonadota bacterium]
MRGAQRLPGSSVRVHRVPDLRADEITTFHGIPVTTPARTILDLAGALGPRELEGMVAQAERTGLATREEITALAARYPRRAGTRRLRALLARGEDPAFTRSKLEAAVLDMTRTARLPKPQTNVLLCGYEVDFFFRGAGVVLEVDGFVYHSSRASFEADRRRDMAMEAEGYRVIRVTWRQIRKERDAVLARLAQALAQAGAHNGPGQI